jgi:hypothetical protein
MALKVATGRINAVSGQEWRPGLGRDPQDYVVLPDQPWLDGYAVEKGIIRQFVAMPLGEGYSAEEQITGAAAFGGIQLQAFPLKAEARFEGLRPQFPRSLADLLPLLVPSPPEELLPSMASYDELECEMEASGPGMGLGAGGRMRQEIYEDTHGADDWDLGLTSRCCVHLCNSLVWRAITDAPPPQPPPTAAEYARHDLPWFDYYRDDLAAVKGSAVLAGLKSVAQLGQGKKTVPLPENQSVVPGKPFSIGPSSRPGADRVREWSDDQEQ